MADINLSKAVRSNLSSLQNTATLMAKTQDRLSTGNKVNSALDNPTNFFTAASLNSRAGDLNNLMDSMANGIKTIEAANNGLTSITKTLESMQSTLRQARQDKSFKTESFSLADVRSGNLSISGGALGTSVSNIALTSAVPSSVTAGADFALAKTQGQTTLAYAAANFDEAGDEISFNLNLDGAGAQPVKITKAIADAASGDASGNLNTIDKLQTALQAAIVDAGFDAAGFELANDGTNITLTSTKTGTGSSAAMTGHAFVEDAAAGAGTALTIASGWAANGSDTGTVEGSAAITIGYGAETVDIVLNGNTHDTAAKAAKAINDAIKADNAGKPAAELINVTASVKDGRLVLTGPADGTGPSIEVADTVAASGASNAVFGTAAQRDVVVGAENGGVAKTVDEMVREINAKTKADGTENELYGKIRASNDKGMLRIENLSTTDLNVSGVDAFGKIDGNTTVAASAIEGNAVRADLAQQFNELRDQLDKLSDDASFNGINLLRGDNLKITFNETGTSSIDIQTKGEKSVNSTNLKLETTLTKEDLDSDTGIDTFLDQVKGALNSVRSQASAFGSNLSIVQNRQDFTKSMINTLETGAGNLTLADMNQEAANMMALQTRQSLASSTLSMANQADQGVLQLLR